jgi:hypothetical protein
MYAIIYFFLITTTRNNAFYLHSMPHPRWIMLSVM